MSSDNFDPSMFLDQTTDQASERRPALEVGDYQAMITKTDVQPWVSSKDPTKSGYSLILSIELQVPPGEQDRLGLDKPTLTLTDRVFLDLDGKSIDWGRGKNVGLRRYRDATGTNTPGQTFSLRMLEGRPILVKVGHESYQGNTVERINGVAGL